MGIEGTAPSVPAQSSGGNYYAQQPVNHGYQQPQWDAYATPISYQGEPSYGTGQGYGGTGNNAYSYQGGPSYGQGYGGTGNIVYGGAAADAYGSSAVCISAPPNPYDCAEEHPQPVPQSMSQPVPVVAVVTTGVPPRSGLPTDWSMPLCADCLNCSELCCNVFWCAPCMLGRIHAAVDKKPDTMDWGPCGAVTLAFIIGQAASYVAAMAFGVAMPAFGSLGSAVAVIYGAKHRNDIRRQYNVQGDGCSDVVTAFCCLPCAMCQHHSELTYRGYHPGYTMKCGSSQQTTVTVVAAQPAYAGQR